MPLENRYFRRTTDVIVQVTDQKQCTAALFNARQLPMLVKALNVDISVIVV